MKKLLVFLLAGFFFYGCMASFPTKYEPQFTITPQLGNKKKVTATARLISAFGSEIGSESAKLQTLVDGKIEGWGFALAEGGTHLDITVKNVIDSGEMGKAVLSGVICGLTLYLIPSVAVDNYRMNVTITKLGKEPIQSEYTNSITTYQQIFLSIWGVIVYSPMKAMYASIDDMLDHFLNDLANDNINKNVKSSSTR